MILCIFKVPGKKGKVMERRLQKDFQIGIVEGIIQAVIQNEKEPKDVFGQIAKVIGRKGSSSNKKDWNAVVKQSTIAMDPIGSTNEAVQRQTRRSLRRHLQHQPNSDLASMDPNRLVDYNPNLSEVTPTTRIAYAKFIMGKNKSNEESDGQFILFKFFYLFSDCFLIFDNFFCINNVKINYTKYCVLIHTYEYNHYLSLNWFFSY